MKKEVVKGGIGGKRSERRKMEEEGSKGKNMQKKRSREKEGGIRE